MIDTASPYMTVDSTIYQRLLRYVTSTEDDLEIDFWTIDDEIYCQCTPALLREYPRIVFEVSEGVELMVHSRHLYLQADPTANKYNQQDCIMLV